MKYERAEILVALEKLNADLEKVKNGTYKAPTETTIELGEEAHMSAIVARIKEKNNRLKVIDDELKDGSTHYKKRLSIGLSFLDTNYSGQIEPSDMPEIPTSLFWYSYILLLILFIIIVI